MRQYVQRLADDALAELFNELPAVSVVGPRACGKTTTAARLVPNIVHLDAEDTARVFHENPDAALKAVGEPVVLDEWQRTPEVLGAVKRAVDSGQGTGRFLLTGSAELPLTTKQWPGTGRVVDLRMYGLTVREQLGRLGGPGFIDRLATGNVEQLQPAGSWSESPDITGYLALALRSGFPEATTLTSERARLAWLSGYVDHLVQRDIFATGTSVDQARLRAYFEALALYSASVPQAKTVYDAAGVSRKTAMTYDDVLSRLYVLDLVPAWASNRSKRLVKAPKRYLVDPALVTTALQSDVPGIVRDGRLLGALIDTFVASQIRPEIALALPRPRMFHWRDQSGREVDIVIELPGGRVAGIEVKAAASATRTDAKHLAYLRDQLGDRFVIGLVLYAGPMTIDWGDRLAAAPISTLWA
jgi:predicted AAA+ superfamily ATPase